MYGWRLIRSLSAFQVKNKLTWWLLWHAKPITMPIFVASLLPLPSRIAIRWPLIVPVTELCCNSTNSSGEGTKSPVVTFLAVKQARRSCLQSLLEQDRLSRKDLDLNRKQTSQFIWFCGKKTWRWKTELLQVFAYVGFLELWWNIYIDLCHTT